MRELLVKFTSATERSTTHTLTFDRKGGTRTYAVAMGRSGRAQLHIDLVEEGRMVPVRQLSHRRDGKDLLLDVQDGGDKAEIRVVGYFDDGVLNCPTLFVNDVPMDVRDDQLIELVGTDKICIAPVYLEGAPADAVTPGLAFMPTALLAAPLLLLGGAAGGSGPVRPNPPSTPDLLSTSDTGISATDNLTRVNTPTIRVAFDRGLGAGGTVSLYEGAVLLGTHVLTAGDVANGFVDFVLSAQPDGTHALTATTTGANGLTSANGGTLSIIIDTVAPGAPGLDLPAASDTGRSDTDNLTNIKTPPIRVSLEGTNAVAGDILHLGEGAAILADYTLTAADIANNYVDITLPPQADGSHSLTAHITDVAGNQGVDSLALVVIIDTAAPGAPSLDLPAASDTGQFDTDNLTKINNPPIRVSLSGTNAVQGDVLHLGEGAATLADHTLDATDISNGYVDLNLPVQANGPHALTAHITDAAGNQGADGALTIAIDTVAPTGTTSIVSTPGHPSNSYWPGDTIQITIDFGEDVYLSGAGTPQITLDFDGVTHAATYTGMGNSHSLTFSYTVQTGDLDRHGITVVAGSLDLGGAVLADIAGNNVSLANTGITNDAGHQVRNWFTNDAALAAMNESAFGLGISWADYNGDGYTDLYVGTGSVPQPYDLLYKNNGDGTFVRAEVAAGMTGMQSSSGVAWGDMDGDGFVDLYATDTSGTPGLLYRNNGDGTFTQLDPTVYGIHAMDFVTAAAWADYDGDGHLDLIVVARGTVPMGLALYHNDGTGHFTDVAATAASGYPMTGSDKANGVTWVDYDNDALPDFFVPQDNGQQDLLYHNNGDGTFTRTDVAAGLGVTPNSFSGQWGDYDNDGWQDLIVITGYQRPILYRNKQDGTFETIGNTSVGIDKDGNYTGAAVWGDFDGNSTLDLYISNTDGQDYFYKNNGDGTFTRIDQAVGFIDSSGNYGLGWTDYDGDGKLDMYVAGDGQDLLYHNNGTATPYLDFQLKNSRGIKLATGKVEVFDAVTHALVATLVQNSGSVEGNDNLRLYNLQDGHAYDFRVTYSDNNVKTVVTNGNAVYDVAGAVMETNVGYGGAILGAGAGQVHSVVLVAEASTSTDGSSLLLGTRYADIIAGDAGNDVIRGNGGDDLINLSAGGNDTLQYIFIDGNSLNGGNGTDTVLGLSTAALAAGGTKIDLSGLLMVHTAGPVTGDASSADEATGQVSLDIAGGMARLYVDRDGGGDEFQELLHFATAETNAMNLLNQMLAQGNLVM